MLTFLFLAALAVDVYLHCKHGPTEIKAEWSQWRTIALQATPGSGFYYWWRQRKKV